MSLLPFPEDTNPFQFSGSVGRNGDNDRADVIKAQMLLSSLGEFDLPAPGMPTGWAGEPLFRAIGNVQKANGLPVDGLLLPLRDGMVGENGEGETLMSLQGRPAADRQPDGERLIPPETKDWISGLPPAQQPLAEGLAGIIVEAQLRRDGHLPAR